LKVAILEENKQPGVHYAFTKKASNFRWWTWPIPPLR
jgi:hypothetical protein